MSGVTFDMRENGIEVHQMRAEPWNVTLIDTGDTSMTGGRLLRVANHLRDEETVFFTYGDGVADIDIAETLRFHLKHGRKATLTATHPPARFGALDIVDGQVSSFIEKPKGAGGRSEEHTYELQSLM